MPAAIANNNSLLSLDNIAIATSISQATSSGAEFVEHVPVSVFKAKPGIGIAYDKDDRRLHTVITVFKGMFFFLAPIYYLIQRVAVAYGIRNVHLPSTTIKTNSIAQKELCAIPNALEFGVLNIAYWP